MVDIPPVGQPVAEHPAAESPSAERSRSQIAAAAAADAALPSGELLGTFLDDVVQAATDGRRLNRAEIAACTRAGAAAAADGIAARAVVDLYLTATWRLWQDAPPPGEPRHSALWVLRAADDAVAALIEGFQVARADLVRLEESARHDVVEALLAGGSAALAATAGAAELGLPISGPLVVAVASCSPRIDVPATAGLPAAIETALRGRTADASPLVLFREERLLVVAAAPDRQAVLEISETLQDTLRASLGPYGAADTDWRAAVSLPRSGPVSVRASFAEAQEALDLARRAALPDPVVNAGDLALYRVLLRDRDAAWDLVEQTLTGLDSRPGRDLLTTLATYLDCGGNATATAQRLHLSVRAVTYRLQRTADLIGRDPGDLDERLTLHAAVTAARLLGWPANRPEL